MNRGYAFGFLIVLLIVLIGMYVAYTGYRSARQAQLAQASAAPTERPVPATRPPTRAPARASATLLPIITPSPEVTATNTPEPAQTEPGSPPDEPTQAPEDTPVPAPTQPPRPPATPQPAFQFRVLASRPDSSQPGCCYIWGSVRDAGGNLLEGIQLQATDEWGNRYAGAAKGGVDLGTYNLPISSTKARLYVVVLDGAGNAVSSQVVVTFDPAVAGWYRVDWQRTY